MAETRARKPRVSTRTGDTGYTSLLGSERVRKDDRRIEALGDLDEATSAIGVARSRSSGWLSDLLKAMQVDLYLLMAEVAAGAVAERVLATRIGVEQVARLDVTLAELRERAALKPEFVIPGDSPLGASLDVARAVARRAERRVAGLAHAGLVVNESVLEYLNRLSDVLFVAARLADSEANDGSEAATGQPRGRSGIDTCDSD